MKATWFVVGFVATIFLVWVSGDDIFTRCPYTSAALILAIVVGVLMALLADLAKTYKGMQ